LSNWGRKYWFEVPHPWKPVVVVSMIGGKMNAVARACVQDAVYLRAFIKTALAQVRRKALLLLAVLTATICIGSIGWLAA
jgi:hypothetical protein